MSRIKPCLAVHRESKWPLLNIVNAVLYVCGEGVKWRAVPGDFAVPWQTVYWYFSKWRASGGWQAANEVLVMARRQSGGHTPLPTTLIIDSQSVKNTPTATARTGTDGGKKIKGRKRLVLTDGAGNLLAAKVLAANCHDGPAALRWWRSTLVCHPLLSQVRLIRADRHFGGVFKKHIEATTTIGVAVANTLVERPAQRTMPVHKGRWLVERTLAWEANSRRLSKDYERRTECAEAFLIISSVARLLKHPTCLE